MPQKTMPWCIKGNAMVSNVLSWPPCSEEVEVKTPAGLLINAPVNQSGLVPSRKYFNGAAMLPKRVGFPITKPAQCLRSSSVEEIAPISGTGGRLASVSGGTDVIV